MPNSKTMSGYDGTSIVVELRRKPSLPSHFFVPECFVDLSTIITPNDRLGLQYTPTQASYIVSNLVTVLQWSREMKSGYPMTTK